MAANSCASHQTQPYHINSHTHSQLQASNQAPPSMVSVFNPPPPPFLRNHSVLSSSSLAFSLPFHHTPPAARTRLSAVRTGPDESVCGSQESFAAEFLGKPSGVLPAEAGFDEGEGKGSFDGEGWFDWEDRILRDTVPLVGFVRMILHSGKYASGDRLSTEHEKPIIERLLPYHPESEQKIGCGIDYITVGYHPDFEGSKCLFIMRKDGELIDFSYWKCIKGLIRKNYPLYADGFILKHFRRRRR